MAIVLRHAGEAAKSRNRRTIAMASRRMQPSFPVEAGGERQVTPPGVDLARRAPNATQPACAAAGAARLLRGLSTPAARAAYLEWHARALEARLDARPPRGARSGLAALAPPVDPAALEREIEGLPGPDRLCENEHWLVARAPGRAIPSLLREIGRTREESFRAAGEGTGRSLDLDRFDPDYWHLVAWSRSRRAIAGAYRLAETDRVLRVAGVGGLYTSTLFAYSPAFFARLGPALELGRAFVRPEYQRSLALAQLWRGLARWLRAGGPSKLFGAVSLSCEYGEFSRRLVAAVLLRHRAHPALEGLALARNPLRGLDALRADPALDCLEDPALLSAVVAAAEPDGKPLPVLLREYLKLGARFVSWSVDPGFADSLDGLVAVDLSDSEGAVARWAAERREVA
jgi:hypothetical protein